MEYSSYKVVHLIGVILTLTSLGGIIVYCASGVANESWRRISYMTNGLGLLLTLFGGFGLIAKLGVGFPGWVLVKVMVWVLLGALIVLARKAPKYGSLYWWGSLLLASVAAYLGHLKPF